MAAFLIYHALPCCKIDSTTPSKRLKAKDDNQDKTPTKSNRRACNRSHLHAIQSWQLKKEIWSTNKPFKFQTSLILDGSLLHKWKENKKRRCSLGTFFCINMSKNANRTAKCLAKYTNVWRRRRATAPCAWIIKKNSWRGGPPVAWEELRREMNLSVLGEI